MIELQRAKLGLPPMARNQLSSSTSGATPSAANASGVPSPSSLQLNNGGQSAASLPAPAPRLTPQQQAAATLYAEEEQLKLFLEKIQKRTDDNANSVPFSLSRRMLQRQGVGFLDDTVASVVSASGDRFLATLLQQAIACREQRLKGVELQKEEARQRRKHRIQHKADSDDRKRRKTEKEEQRHKKNLEAVAAAEGLKASGAAAAAASPAKKKKKKKATENGEKGKEDEESLSDDSLDEEEEYYEKYYGEDDDPDSESDEEEEDDSTYMLLLRDLERPLEAWNVHLTGKVGLGTVTMDASAEPEEEDDERAAQDDEAPQEVELDGGENSSQMTSNTGASPADKKKAENADKGRSASRASTPAPPSSASTQKKTT